MGIGERREIPRSSLLKWLFQSGCLNPCALQMISPPNAYPAGLPVLAIAAVSFSAHRRPRSLPPVPPAPLRPRRTAAAALGMLPLFPGTRNPRFHQPAETRGCRPWSRSRPGSRTGAHPVASRGGPGGRERAKASVGPGLLGGDIPGDSPRPSASCSVRFPPIFLWLVQRTEAPSPEAPSGRAARPAPPRCLPGTPRPAGPPLAAWLLLRLVYRRAEMV